MGKIKAIKNIGKQEIPISLKQTFTKEDIKALNDIKNYKSGIQVKEEFQAGCWRCMSNL